MKLKNKRTGEIGNFCYGYKNELCVSWQKDDGFWGKQEYNSLSELNEEWEDYEEVETTIIPELSLEIQLEDYKQGRDATFTYNEVMELKFEDGWRLPTRHDWVMICEAIGNTADGALDKDKIIDELNLTEDKNGVGGYWTSTDYSVYHSYILSFNMTVIDPEDYSHKNYALAVRLVRDI